MGKSKENDDELRQLFDALKEAGGEHVSPEEAEASRKRFLEAIKEEEGRKIDSRKLPRFRDLLKRWPESFVCRSLRSVSFRAPWNPEPVTALNCLIFGSPEPLNKTLM